MNALALLARFYREAIIAALLCAFAITIGLYTASGKRKDRRIEALSEQVATANAKLQISNASINQLTDALNAKNAESEARAASYAAVKAQDARDVAAADKALAADKSRMATLQALAKAAAERKDCPVPSALTVQLEGM